MKSQGRRLNTSNQTNRGAVAEETPPLFEHYLAGQRTSFDVSDLTRRRRDRRQVSAAGLVNEIVDGMDLPRFLRPDIHRFFRPDIVRVAMFPIPEKRAGDTHWHRSFKGALYIMIGRQELSQCTSQFYKRLRIRITFWQPRNLRS